MVGEHVASDAEQPQADVGFGQVVAPAPGNGEDLRSDVVGVGG